MDCEVIEYTNSTKSTNVIIHNYFKPKSVKKPQKVLNYFNATDGTSKDLVSVLNET